MKKKILISVVIIIILIPIGMWGAWMLTPKKKMVAIIVDKTELPEGNQHASFTWILNHERYTKTTKSLYSISNDYFGFFPLQNEKFRIKGLERFSDEMIDKLSNDADLAYYTDTYGVYKKEWYHKQNSDGMIYGGLSDQDVELLQKMKEKHKLIMAEFNTIGDPTSEKNRNDFENLFGIKWIGWVGCYFASLDSSHSVDLPKWVINDYRKDNNGQWPFHQAGIVFVNTKKQVIILEKGKDLRDAIPTIKVKESEQINYQLPAEIHYPHWFDVMQYDSSVNEAIATFQINTTTAGKQILKNVNLADHFPAILKHQNNDYRFYYFSGNFCNNPVSFNSSYFNGIDLMNRLFYPSKDVEGRRNFFWNFYRPLMTEIMNEYYRSISKN